MDFLEVTAGPNDSDRRIDKILRLYLPDLPLSEIYKLIRKGLIKVNGKKTKAEYKVIQDDVISYPKFLTENNKKSASDIRAEYEYSKILPPLPPVVFKNEHILILDKPYDMLVHGTNDSLDKIVEDYYRKNFNSTSLSFKPGPLHRIDRKTTGLIAFSLSLKGAQWFSENIKNHSINKKYLGLIQGKLQKEELWKDFIKKDQNPTSKKFHTVNASKTKNENDEKEAVTTVSPIAWGIYKDTEVTYVQFDIKTGRTHQIRAQSALHNHPLLGDTAYGGKSYKELKQEFYLQAYKLTLPENQLELPSLIEISPSKEFKEILNKAGIKTE